MNIKGILAARSCARPVSRRQFGRIVAGTAVLGGTVGTGLLRPALADTIEPFVPVPIPGGTPALGGGFHVFAPGLVDPVDAEPITITDFNGFVGLAYLSGMVTQSNTTTHQVQRFPFLLSDMRFMRGVFRGADGNVHQGTFALV